MPLIIEEWEMSGEGPDVLLIRPAVPGRRHVFVGATISAAPGVADVKWEIAGESTRLLWGYGPKDLQLELKVPLGESLRIEVHGNGDVRVSALGVTL